MPISLTTVMPFFYPATQMGGPVVQAYEVNKRLVQRGHRVSVVTTDIGIDDAIRRNQWIDFEGMRVWYGATRSWNRAVPYWEPQLAQPLNEVLPATDVVQLRMGLTLLNDLVRRLGRRYGRPYVYNAEGALCPTRLLQKRMRKAVFLRMYERRIVRDAAALQAVTAVELRDLVAQGADSSRIELIPNGVQQRSREHAGKRDFREEWQVAEHAKVLLFLGRITLLKGIEPLLRGFSKLARDHRDLVLVVAGPDDGEAARLKPIAETLGVQSQVRFPGAIHGGDRWDALRAADLFALTSYTEGLPNAVLEALSVGVPVVISPECNLPEVAAAQAGRVVEVSPDAIAAALLEMFNDEALRASMSQNARRLVAEKFDIEKIVDRLERLYLRIANEKS